MDDDATLVARACEGERAAFATLVGRHYDLMFRVAWRFCGRREDAEDVAQDVCVRLPRALPKWSARGRFESWLCSIVVNAVRDRQRKLAAERRHHEAFAREPRPEPQDEEGPLAEMWAAVRALPDKQREAVTLVHGEGLSHAEAGAAMDCAETTVSYHIHAARKRLREMLKEEA